MAKKVWQLSPNDEVLQPGDASGGGGLEGHVLTVRGYDVGHKDSLFAMKADGSTQLVQLSDEHDTVQVQGVAAYIVQNPNKDITAAAFLAADATVTIAAPCLVEGTMILLADGTEKPVEEVGYGDLLAVWDFDAGRLSSARPLWIKVAQESGYFWRTRFSSGRVLETMGHSGHRVFSLDANRFEYVVDCVGHAVPTADGGTDRVAETVRVEEPCRYYNLITDRHVNLFANGVLTGCSLENGLYPVKNRRFAMDGRPVRPFAEFEGEVSREWYDGCRYGESSLERDYLLKYFRDRILLMACRASR